MILRPWFWILAAVVLLCSPFALAVLQDSRWLLHMTFLVTGG
jgi:hypothetical protein